MKDLPVSTINASAGEKAVDISSINSAGCYVPQQGDKITLEKNMKGVQVPFKTDDGQERTFTKVYCEVDSKAQGKSMRFVTEGTLFLAHKGEITQKVTYLCTEDVKRHSETKRLQGAFKKA